jgi:hypothetical protein
MYVMSRLTKFSDDGEHECGVFFFAGYAFEWRIEYLNHDETGPSPDPSDPGRTFRVLSIFAAGDLLLDRGV